jgi:hypothetical protein
MTGPLVYHTISMSPGLPQIFMMMLSTASFYDVALIPSHH